MTVPAQGFSGPTWVQLPGNGSATVFAFPFLITAATDLAVGFVSGTSYSEQTSGFTVQCVYPGNGTVTFATPPPSGIIVDLRSQIPETQPTNFSNLGAYYPQSTTNAMDRTTRLVTDLYRLTYLFGIHGPDQESMPWSTLPNAAGRANSALLFDSNGLPTIGVLTSTVFTQATWNAFASSGLYQAIAAESSVSIVNFLYPPGHVLRYGTNSVPGATDMTAAIQAALNVAGAPGGCYRAYAPAQVYMTTAPLTIQNGLALVGDGCEPYVGQPEGAQRGDGTWFYFNHAGKGIIAATAGSNPPDSGLKLEKFGTYRNQPAPAPGWAPNANDYDIWVSNFGGYAEDLMLLNATSGIYVTSAAALDYAQFDITRLRGQVFNDFIHLDTVYDVCKVSRCHRWSFWADDPNVHTYEQANANFAYLARADGPMFSDNFAISINSFFKFVKGANGVTTRFQAVNCYADTCVYAVNVDASVGSGGTGGVLGQINNLVTTAPAGSAASNNILISGSNCIIDFGAVELQAAGQNAVQVGGSGNTVSFAGPFRAALYNQSGGGFYAVNVGAGNNVVIGMHPTIDASGAGRYNGAGGIWVDDWRPFSPNPVASGGSVTFGASSGNYKMSGTTLEWEVSIAVTSDASGTGAVIFTLPQGASAPAFIGNGYNTGTGPKGLSVVTNGVAGAIYNYDGTFPGNTGAVLACNGKYQIVGL